MTTDLEKYITLRNEIFLAVGIMRIFLKTGKTITRTEKI